MNSLLLYVIQVAVVSGLLYGYYHFFLRNKSFHQYNRFYLLFCTVISLIVPVLQIPVYFQNATSIPVIYQTLAEIRLSPESEKEVYTSQLSWWQILQIVYVLAVTIGIAGILFSIRKVYRIARRSKKVNVQGVLFIETEEKDAPYSFFNWLFWKKDIQLSSAHGQHILHHELYHIRQKHSWDIIYLQALSAIVWINPFFHLIKKEVKAIHEFLADQHASDGNSKLDYAELLVMQVLQTKTKLVHPFFNNQLKRRLTMIIKPTKNSFQYLRKLAGSFLFVIITTLITVQCKSTDEKESNTPANTEVTSKDNNIASTDLPKEIETTNEVAEKPAAPKTDATNEAVQDIDDNKIFEKVEIDAKFRGGVDGWKKFLHRNLNPLVPSNNGAPDGVYTTIVQFIVKKNGEISDVKALTNHGYGMEDEAVRVIKKGPTWVPALQNGKEVNAYRKQPITFQVTS